MKYPHQALPIFVLTAVLCCVFWYGAAHAQTKLFPEAFAPWLEEQNLTVTASALDADAPHKIHQLNKYEKEKAARPMITPRETFALMEQLEGRETRPPSQLEESYSARIVDELTQYGYELFGAKRYIDKTDASNDEKRNALPAGAVQDSYVLNIGDRLTVTFSGQRTERETLEVGNDGLLLIKDLPPITAAGRTIGQLRDMLDAEMKSMHNTQAFVSLDAIRQIDILIVGHVERPGRQTLTVFHTILDALMEAGGVEKTGSLRQIKLVRDGRSTIIDLYGLLIHGSTNMDVALRDGDRIIVPPIGPTVAVAGSVKRPGIYELLPQLKGMLHKPENGSQKINLEEALELGGGVLTPGKIRYLKLGLDGDGKENVREISAAYQPVFSDGSILMVSPHKEMRSGTVELTGHTRHDGLHDIDETPTLAKLLPDKSVFGPDIYPLIGVIERWDETEFARKLIAFPPLLVLKGQFDRTLQDGDVVHLFSRDQMLHLDSEQDPQGAKLITVSAGMPVGSADELAQDEFIHDPVLASFLTERSVFVRGAVRQAGAWPVAEGINLKNIIAVTGGLALEANTRNIEVTSALHGEGHQAEGRSGTKRVTVDYVETDPETVMLEPGDSVRVNQKFKKVDDSSVLLIGEVNNPGRYDLLPGDKMSDLIERAGGMTAQAYPDGAIFSRNSERKAEESRFRATARDLERALAAAMDDPEKAPDASQIAMARDLAAELRQVEAVGRITVEADPGILAAQPDLDILLESGDRVYIPKRPLNVRVRGEILSPAALQFRKNKDPRDYIAEGGGFTYHADKDRVFVLYPDGSAQPLQVNVWNHTPIFIPPGSTIVVPRDPKPFDFIQSAKDISQILSNLAITGIFLDDIRDN